METYYTNTTNITCKSNLVVRKHTLESRIDELKNEFVKQASNIMLKKTRDTITRYKHQTSVLLNDDVFRKKVTAVVGPVFETTQTLCELNKAIITNQKNTELVSRKKSHSVEVLHRQLKIKRRIKSHNKYNDDHCNKDNLNDKHPSNHHKHKHSHHHHHKHHHCHKCNEKENYFNDLYNQWAIIQINKYVDDLMKERYHCLRKKLTKKHIDELIDSLNAFKLTCNIGYIRIIDLYIIVIQIIFSNVSLMYSLETGEPVEKYKYDKQLLSFREQINQYLLSMNVILNQQKQKYILYDEKYGQPIDGIYDASLLMEIDETMCGNDSNSELNSDSEQQDEYEPEEDLEYYSDFE